jgi:hypothetical protein
VCAYFYKLAGRDFKIAGLTESRVRTRFSFELQIVFKNIFKITLLEMTGTLLLRMVIEAKPSENTNPISRTLHPHPNLPPIGGRDILPMQLENSRR